ncbi:MAG: hypothetical protein WCL57_05355 [Chloroflexota bacterium]|jgi:hypothetical protein|nr:hypothetical protein [Chloroflexota bacterium]
MQKFSIPIAKWAIIWVTFAGIGASYTLQTPTPSATISAFPTLVPLTPAPIANIAATNTALPTPVVNETVTDPSLTTRPSGHTQNRCGGLSSLPKHPAHSP